MLGKVLVTGAGGGIGKAIAKELAIEGYLVLAQYRNRPIEGGENIIPIYGELSTEEGIDAFLTAVRAYGRMDGLVNCAGISQDALLVDLSDGEIMNILNTDLTSTILLTKRILPDMMTKGKGSIVNISSIWGEKGSAMETVYSAAKGGIIAFSKALSKEVGRMGVRVNCVSPGMINTEMNACYTAEERADFCEKLSLGREGDPSEVADLVAFLIGDKSNYITGQNITVDGGME